MPEHIHLPLQQRLDLFIRHCNADALRQQIIGALSHRGLMGGYQWDWFDAYRGEALEISTIPYI